MSKKMPVTKLQSELRETFGRNTLSQSASPAPRGAGKPAKRERAKASERSAAVPHSRSGAPARARRPASARRKLTCPIDASLYRSLQLESFETEQPIREIVETLLKERYTDSSS